MYLWIRTQDKMNLVKVNQININYKNTCQIIANYIPDFIGKEGEYYETLGNYNSKERALEVLDEIQERILNIDTIKTILNIPNEDALHTISKKFEGKSAGCIYQMPQE